MSIRRPEIRYCPETRGKRARNSKGGSCTGVCLLPSGGRGLSCVCRDVGSM